MLIPLILAATGDDVDVHGPCFYQYLCWCDWSFLPLLMMLLSRIQSVTQNDVDVTDPHYQWKTCWRHWSLLYLLTMLMSMIPPTMGQLEEVILNLWSLLTLDMMLRSIIYSASWDQIYAWVLCCQHEEILIYFIQPNIWN